MYHTNLIGIEEEIFTNNISSGFYREKTPFLPKYIGKNKISHYRTILCDLWVVGIKLPDWYLSGTDPMYRLG